MLPRISFSFFLILLFAGCDFTPRIHKEILEAQQLLLDQSYAAAVARYEKILEEDVSETIREKIYFQLSEINLLHYGNNEKSLSYLKKIKQSSRNLEAVIKAEEKMGNINFSFADNYKSALLSYRKLMNFDPPLKESIFYRFRYGRSLILSENYNEAIKIFSKFPKNNEYFLKSQFYLGQSYFYSQRWKLAIKTLRNYLTIQKKNENKIEAQFIIASSYESLENLKAAYDSYYTLLSEYPNPEVIKNKLNSIYERQISSKR